jgi:hypothetical protein
VTEHEWQSSLDPIQMLQAKELPVKLDDVSNMRWRLFMAGCLRIIWDTLPDEARQAVEATEEYASGWRSAEGLEQFVPSSSSSNPYPNTTYGWLTFRWTHPSGDPVMNTDQELEYVIRHMTHVTDFERADVNHHMGYQAEHAYQVCRLIQLRYSSRRAGPAPEESSSPRHPWHATFISACQDVNLLASDLLRCVVGNPYRIMYLDPAWQTSSVEGLLLGILEDRAYDRLPILADALEEAGCEDQVLLNHCRFQARHSVGCWAAHLLKPPPAPKAKTSSYWPLRTS